VLDATSETLATDETEGRRAVEPTADVAAGGSDATGGVRSRKLRAQVIALLEAAPASWEHSREVDAHNPAPL
jgi:hypothetical protein